METIRVLYAEDSPYDADLTISTFQANFPEFQIYAVGTGQDFLTRLRDKTRAYDLLLVDQLLPDIDGLDLLKQISAIAPDTPVVMVTGFGDEELAMEALRLGASDYVPKEREYLASLPSVLKRIWRERGTMRRIGALTSSSSYKLLFVGDCGQDTTTLGQHICTAVPNCAIDLVGSAHAAMNKVSGSSFGYDLVITDIPVYDGALELLRKLRQLELGKPLIMIVNESEEDAAIAMLRLGVYDYIVKREHYMFQLPYTINNALIRFQLSQRGAFLQDELEILTRSLAGRINERTVELQREIVVRKQAEQAIVMAMARQQTFLHDVLMSVTEGKFHLCANAADLPERAGGSAIEISLTHNGQLAVLREKVREAAAELDFAMERTFDLITSVSEAGMNALTHAGGGKAIVYIDRERRALQIWIEDAGQEITMENLPRATLERGFTTAGTLGLGFKLILLVVRRLWLLTGTSGTTVVIEENGTGEETQQLYSDPWITAD